VAKEILKFFDWVYSADGDKLAASLDYVPLPPAVVKQIEALGRRRSKTRPASPSDLPVGTQLRSAAVPRLIEI